jgi:NAD(P)-dependent dehydrogenase (short-subunit alcohol dehydrogenase family)
VSEDAELKGRSNIRILEADVTKYSDLEKAAADAAKITGGKLDYVIANAGIVPMFDAYDPIGDL